MVKQTAYLVTTIRRRRRVVGEDRGVTPECPRDEARLQRSAGEVPSVHSYKCSCHLATKSAGPGYTYRLRVTDLLSHGDVFTTKTKQQ